MTSAPEGIEDPKSQDIKAQFDIQMKAEDTYFYGGEDAGGHDGCLTERLQSKASGRIPVTTVRDQALHSKALL